MKELSKFLQAIPRIMNSKVSIIIYILMFIYLVIIPLVAFIPGCEWLMPSTPAMLIGDNYTSVLAALGASIAAGTGVAVHHHVAQQRTNHDKMQRSIDELHRKIDALAIQHKKPKL
ncbi:MAG: hypothetical protein LBH36_03115 [Candidatus Nomurabacteria bacterium]|jgi:hypothetical protein|nr:hypothetical protein [Candidatus Nomurabacteria bacterium]